MPPISNVRKHFTEVNNNLAVFNVSRKQHKTCENTSNLRSHFKTNNKTIPQMKMT